MDKNTRFYCHEGAQCKVLILQVTDQVALRVLCYSPAFNCGNNPIVIIGGLSTIVDSFRNIICDLTKDFPLYFVETRERATSVIKGNVQFDIATMGMDNVAVIRLLGLEDRKYILMGYSFGASVIADSYGFLKSKPGYVLFMEPTPAFHYPGWSIFLIRWFGVPLYKLLKPIGKWYLGKFLINKREDNEMAVISSQSLDNADPEKLRKSILAISNYTVWGKLDAIDCPVLIIGTSKDHLHNHDEITRMVTEIKNCTFTDMETNLRTHSSEMGEVIRSYINNSSEKLKTY